MSRRKHISWISLAATVIAAGIVIAQQQGVLDDGKKSLSTNQPGTYAISRFVDGDTIAVDMNGTVEKVRFVGIDTPETHKPNTPVQCYGPAAAAFTKNSIGSQHVRLVSDPLSTDRDRYNRLLRYVYLPDGTLLNKKLVENGYAFYYPYFPFSKSDEFASAQASAKAANKGLWGNCHPTQTSKGGWISNNQGE